MSFSNLEDAISAYEEKFTEFPSWDLLNTYNIARVLAIVSECIEKNKTAVELGYIEETPDNIYT